MKNVSNWDWESVKIVLSEGKTQANELKQQLNPITASSREACVILIEMLLSSYDNALALINDDVCNNSSNSVEDDGPKKSKETKNSFKNHKLPRVSKKRKKEQSEQVRVRSEKSFESLMNDGYNWRKYGQKVILKATHPRAYYRCTHRHTQGCLATKQVQRADDDPSIFQVIYIDKHTCTEDTTKYSFETTNKDEDTPKQMSMINHIDEVKEDSHFPLFAFPTITNEPEEDLKIKSFSEENGYFSASHWPINDFSTGQSFIQSSESDFGEIYSSPTRVGDFVFGDIDTHFLDACW